MMRQKFSKFIFLISDIFCMMVSYIFAAIIRGGVLKPGVFYPFYFNIFLIIILLYIILYEETADHNENDLKRGLFDEFMEVTKKQFELSILVTLYLFITQNAGQYSRVMFIVFFLINVMFIYTVRSYSKLVLLLGYKSSKASSKVMLITIYEDATKNIQKFRSEYEWSMQITTLAIMDMNYVGNSISGIPVVANKENIFDVLKNQVIDEVFIILPNTYKLDLEELILEFENMGIVVHLYINIFNNIKLHDKKIQKLGGYQVITFATKICDIKQLIIKRTMDILGGVVGIVLMALMTILIAPIIKLESKGPIFFTQTRIGKNGRLFTLYKFRSMYADAELRKKELMNRNEMKGFMFKIDKDPRITKLGRFLRKTSLDEFPQFINVLKGDMSLVGTRPPTIDEFESYEACHLKRLSIRPGITGLWQTSGRSNIKDFDEVVRLDLEYIDNWSVLLDIKLILKTVVVVLFRRGSQ